MVLWQHWFTIELISYVAVLLKAALTYYEGPLYVSV